ncbi:MAG TPA: translation initiation factor [Armatimonadota bacterium]|jgi:translation initiation factor 1
MARKQPPQSAPAAPAPSALAAQLAARGFAATPPAPAPEAKRPTPPGEKPIDLASRGKLVVRHERKGRGGKTVTVLSGLSLPPPNLDHIARAMRKGLGCGATVEQGTIVLQGDLTERAADWLRKHGATQVVLGN